MRRPTDIAVRPYRAQVPYGLVELDGSRISGIAEKPLVRGLIVCGVGHASLSVTILLLVGATALVVRLVRLRL